MRDNTQSRKYLLTINNPLNCGFTRDKILEELNKLSLDYFCLADELASTGTEHTHIFIYSKSPMRFSTIKNRFSIAHIDKAYGSVLQNKEYVSKSGKWKESEKNKTAIENSFFEYGEIPTEQDEKAPMMAQLLSDIRNGETTAEIINKNPKMAFRVKDIDVLRETILSEKYMKESRLNLQVHYLFGATGTGKTRSIYQKHSPMDVCRITNYKGDKVLFDAYHGQPVLVFEEFRSQIPIADMLSYLDVYPLMLPARYSDRVACYTIVYIVSNIDIERQYLDVQRMESTTWDAFMRRICSITQFEQNNKKVIYRKEIDNNELQERNS